MNFLDVACYVSTEYLLADYQIINQILLETRTSKPAPRNSKLWTLQSELATKTLLTFYSKFQNINSLDLAWTF